MPNFHGPIQHVTIAGTLWLLLALPLAASLFAARFALAGRMDARAREAVAIVSVGAMAAAFAVAAYHAALLVGRPEGEGFLLQHGWRMVRLGQLDVSLDLALDPLAASVAMIVTAVGVAVLVFAATALKADPRYARVFAWLDALVLATLVVALAGNFVLLFFGWEGIGLCAWALLGSKDRSARKRWGGGTALLLSRVGSAGLALGIALFYWGFGGAWVDGEYAPDLGPRFASVEVRSLAGEQRAATDVAAPDDAAEPGSDEEPEERAATPPPSPSSNAEGFVTLTSYAGAIVFMDDARSPLRSPAGELLRSPFVRAPVRAGVHSFRVHPGGGLDDFLVTRVVFGGGLEIALVPFGPTVVFREARDQLAARDGRGKASVQSAMLAKRGWGRTALVTVVSLLFLLGIAGMGAHLPLFEQPDGALSDLAPVSTLLSACALAACVDLAARVGFFLALSPAASTIVAAAGAALALLAALAGTFRYDVRRVLACAAASQLGLMVLAAGSGGSSAAVVHLIVAALGLGGLGLAAGAVSCALRAARAAAPDEHDVRRMGGLRQVLPQAAWAYAVGCVALTAAPVPGLGAIWAEGEELVRALIARDLVAPSTALFFAGLLAMGMTSFALWRSYYLVFEGAPATDLARVRAAPKPLRIPSFLLVVGSALLGLILGVCPRLLGKEGQSPFGEWLAPALGASAPAPGRPSALVAWAVLTAVTLASATGWWRARSRYAARAADWEATEARAALFGASRSGFGLDVLVERGVVPLTGFARDLAAEIDRRVLDGVLHGTALGTRAVAWVLGRADEHVVDGTVQAFARGTLKAADRVQAAQTGRVQTYVYVLVLGLLALALLPYWLR